MDDCADHGVRVCFKYFRLDILTVGKNSRLAGVGAVDIFGRSGEIDCLDTVRSYKTITNEIQSKTYLFGNFYRIRDASGNLAVFTRREIAYRLLRCRPRRRHIFTDA